MFANTVARGRRSRGFTLVELMAVVLIASILLSIAVPLYMQQVRKGRRTDAKTAVMDLAGREERMFSTTNAYSIDPTQLGYAAVGSGAAFPQVVGNGYYNITVAAPTATTFTITATAITADQLKDTSCFSFSVTQTGAQSSLSSAGGSTTTTCWQ
ncbi:MAG TPA: type IV pilin protein [Steroidobacteraceae bacterium]